MVYCNVRMNNDRTKKIYVHYKKYINVFLYFAKKKPVTYCR